MLQLKEQIEELYRNMIKDPSASHEAIIRQRDTVRLWVTKGLPFDSKNMASFYPEEYYFHPYEDIIVLIHSDLINQKAYDPLWEELRKSGSLPKPPAEKITAPVNQKTPRMFHRHDFFEMFYVFQGRTLSCAGDYDVDFLQGDLCLYNLNSVHFQSPSSDAVLFNILIRKKVIDSAFCSLLADRDLFTHFFVHSLQSKSPENCMIVRQIQNSMLEIYLMNMILEFFGRNNPTQLRALLYCILNEVSRQYEKQSIRKSLDRRSNVTIVAVINYLKSHCATATLQSTADFFHYSERKMITYFQDSLGTTFSKALQKIRLDKAAGLLESTKLPIETIVSKTGYSNRRYLEHLFKENFGVTMLQYRKQRQKCL